MEERICRNCRYFSVIDGKPLCFAVIGRQGRPVPRGVMSGNKCHTGRFATRNTAQEIKKIIEK